MIFNDFFHILVQFLYSILNILLFIPNNFFVTSIFYLIIDDLYQLDHFSSTFQRCFVNFDDFYSLFQFFNHFLVIFSFFYIFVQFFPNFIHIFSPCIIDCTFYLFLSNFHLLFDKFQPFLHEYILRLNVSF